MNERMTNVNVQGDVQTQKHSFIIEETLTQSDIYDLNSDSLSRGMLGNSSSSTISSVSPSPNIQSVEEKVISLPSTRDIIRRDDITEHHTLSW